MSLPVVSIITATLNSAKTLPEMFASVRSQTYPHIEHLVIDGGSTDDTLNVVDKYRSSLAHVISEPDNGIYDAYNKGITASTGELLYFLNSDDCLADPGVIEHFVNRFCEWPEVWAIYGNVRIREGQQELILGRSLSIDDIRQGHRPSHQALFVRRHVFERFGLFDTRYQIAGDFDLMVRLFIEPGDRIRYENRIVAEYRMGGISSRYDTRMTGLREAEIILRRYFGKAPDLTGTEIRNNALYRMWLENLLVRGRGITSVLKPDFQRIAVFGTRMTARYLLEDLRREGLTPICFLDNDPHIQGKEIEGVPIHSPDWLFEHPDAVEAVIVSVENEYDDELIEWLKEKSRVHLPVCSWKKLAIQAFMKQGV